MMDDLFGKSTKLYSVGELTRNIRGLLETRFRAVWVQGEVSNYRRQPSGHQYFTLKDARAQISCVIFRSAGLAIRTPLSDGAQIQVFGNLNVFEPRGQYQINVQAVQARGAGLLQAKFEALKRKLEAEGLFDPARKRPLPKFPRRIGLITSPSGAAVRDMLNILSRRAPQLEILINPVRVQGIGAAAEIATAIRELNLPNESWAPLDLIVVTRGGGSIEDLWEFNEEIVARAIFHSALPVVSAVGHEIDFTISDFVADLRAPTPSAAAELIAPDVSELQRRIAELAAGLRRSLGNFLSHAQTRLRFLSERTLGRELRKRFEDAQQQLDWTHDRLQRHLRQQIAETRAQLEHRAAIVKAHSPQRELLALRERFREVQRRLGLATPQALQKQRDRFARVESVLRALGPEGTLRRGYSITTDEQARIVTSVKLVRPKTKIRTRVRDGEFSSEVVKET